MPTTATDTENRCQSFLGTTAAQIPWYSESACASKSADWRSKERGEELEEDEQQRRQQEQEEEEEEKEEEEEDDDDDEEEGEEKEEETGQEETLK